MTLSKKSGIKGSIIDNCYVVQVSDDVTDSELELLCQETVKKAHDKNVNGVIFSFANVDVIDCFSINLFVNATKTISLLGTKVVWTGLKPGVVSTILDFQIDLSNIDTCLDVNEGLELIK